MTTLYDPDKIAKLASTGDAFWRGAQWILDQQAAAFTMARQSKAMADALDRASTEPRRASFMSDKISMDEARTMAREDYDQEWTPVRNSAGQAYPMPTGATVDEMRNMARAVHNAADLGSPRIP